MQVERWSAYRTGLYNELVIVNLINDLDAAGMKREAATLRNHWEQKVKTFVNGNLNLFQSEYAFDSTGFEATHALAKYALQIADKPGESKSGISRESAERFMRLQLASNIFCRGWPEPAYYLLGSDYRGNGGNSFTLSYMSQMGGWSILDYALNYAAKPDWYLRLGYASYLSLVPDEYRHARFKLWLLVSGQRKRWGRRRRIRTRALWTDLAESAPPSWAVVLLERS